jgi:PAS domain S-box-containing protein
MRITSRKPMAADAASELRRCELSLRGYLMALVVLFILAATAGVAYGWFQSERDALRAAARDAAFGAGLAASQLGVGVESVRTSVAQLAANPTISQVLATPKGCTLSFAVLADADAGRLDLVRSDGTVVCSSRKFEGGDASGGYAEADWLDSALRGPIFAGPVADPTTGRPAVVASRPVQGGLVAGFISLDALGPAVAAHFGGARQLEFLITTADGKTILTRSIDPTAWVGAALEPTPFGRAAAQAERPDVTGAPRQYGRATVERVGWRVYAGADQAEALASARGRAQREALVILAGLAVALAAAFVVYRRITRPIGQLGRAVRAATADAGNTDDAAPIAAAGPTEVARLAEDFNGLVAAVERELAERRRAEQAARELERSYRQLFDSSPNPMCVIDQGTLALLQVNDSAVAHYGYPREEFLTLTMRDLCLPEDVPALVEVVAAAGPVDRAGPLRQVRKDRSVIEVNVTSHALSFAGRDARCSIIEDVTAKEQLERRLRQSQRLESLGQLAGGVAHDFNNLLSIILGYATFAAKEVGAAARADSQWVPVRDDLAQVLRAVDRATSLTRQLLSFAREEVVQLRLQHLNAVVTDIEQMLRRTLGDDVELRTSLAADLPPIMADRGQVEQVLVNLAVNARDAMPGGGALTIDTEQVTVDEHYAAYHPGAQIGEYVRMRVSDTGAGMSQDTIDRAFEPFFTTKPKGQGTGLGLATIHGIVTQAGGHVQIYSELGVGTSITVLFPVTEDTAIEPAAAPLASDHSGRGETILLVEDEDSLRALTARILAGNGYKVIAAADGCEAIGIAERHFGGLDLLLTDVVMPKMLGHELAKRLQEVQPGLRVIYLSGYARPVLSSHKTLPPGVTLLSKPVSQALLFATIRQILDGAPAAAAKTAPRS